MYTLSTRSLDRLNGVHPDLVRVVKLAIQLSEIDFVVLEGVRTKERQALLKTIGASQTMNSRHITGHAVDLGALLNKEVRWDWPLYHKIAKAMKQAANDLNVPIVWGGSWVKFRDGPHYELDRKTYP
jgi:peptidoglycan L-alanyl-D-glutamate endopeptidase CwlK